MFRTGSEYTTARTLKTGILAVGFFALALSAAGFSSPAMAQSSADADNRLRRLENEIQTLSRAVYRGETPEPPAGGFATSGDQAAANIEVRLTQMENDLRDLTGKVEEQSFELTRLRDQIDRMGAEAAARPAATAPAQPPSMPPPGSYGGQQPSAAGMPPQPSYQPSYAPPAATAPTGTELGQMTQGSGGAPMADDPTAMYESAFSYVKSGDYARAETELQAFLQRYPDHDLTPNAKYWLGETYYVRGDFRQAARVFAEAYKQYPKGPKGPDNLLKLGLSLAGMGSKDDACVALGQLSREYPNGAGPVISRARQEMEKLGCP